MEWTPRASSGLAERARLLRRRADEPSNWYTVVYDFSPLFGFHVDSSHSGNPLGGALWVYRLDINGTVCENDTASGESGAAEMPPRPRFLNLTASDNFCDRVRLTWDGVTGDIESIQVRRDGDFGSIIANLPNTARSFDDLDAPVRGEPIAYAVSGIRTGGCPPGGGVCSGELQFAGEILEPPPSSRSLAVGQSLVLSITATSTAGPLRYQWTGPCSSPLVDDGRITGTRGPVLIIRNVTTADVSSVECNRYTLSVQSDCGIRQFSTSVCVTGAFGCPAGCVADFDDGSGTGTQDSGVTIDDLLFYLALYAEGHSRADLDDGSSTSTADGGVTIDDLLYYLLRFMAGC